MRLTKFGHAAVRFEHDGTSLVVDPGVWTQREAVEGVDAVLITHEHMDHYHPELLRAADAPIYTIGAVAAQIREGAPDLAERVTVVRPDEAWSIGSFAVRAVGELHAVIHPELPRFDNSGYLLSGGGTTAYHPGDALTAPGEAVDVLLAPVSAPWMRVSEGVDFARMIGARQTVAIHDRVFSPEGLAICDAQFTRFLEAKGLEYRRLPDGTDL
ncbi:MBL fold metallo-hydrolase [Nocardioides ginsengisoli]|uniref:MBL fold metallo-hydrolase n=1 Tax=Nocardioides ginsengisoli TaxID=363868 RepID=A0ABW3VZG0_9ACTN